jgi:hypothetical protein
MGIFSMLTGDERNEVLLNELYIVTMHMNGKSFAFDPESVHRIKRRSKGMEAVPRET